MTVDRLDSKGLVRGEEVKRQLTLTLVDVWKLQFYCDLGLFAIA